MSKEEQRIEQLEIEIDRKLKNLEAMNSVIEIALKKKKEIKEKLEHLQSELGALKEGQLQLDIGFDLDF